MHKRDAHAACFEAWDLRRLPAHTYCGEEMITVQFAPNELAVFNEIRSRSGLSAEQQIRQMLRWYQLIDNAQCEGWQIKRVKSIQVGDYAETKIEDLSGLQGSLKASLRDRLDAPVCLECKGTNGMHYGNCSHATIDTTIVGPGE